MDEEDHEYATALGGLLSRTIGDGEAFSLHSTARCLEHIEHRHDITECLDATAIGIESSTLRVGSITPRASGFRPGASLKTFGIEKRLRGHVFHLNESQPEAIPL